MKEETIKVLCLGDIVGRAGRNVLNLLDKLSSRYSPDLVIANGENAAGGLGLDVKTALEILKSGVDVVTLGNHTWQRKELRTFLDHNQDKCIRPANFSADSAGRGWTVLQVKGINVGIFNLIGRVDTGFPFLDCPFRKADALIEKELMDCPVKICDFHAEATSEKMAMWRYLDGRISLIFGTHTHVQTADEEISNLGTAYITDLGMCGSHSGVIGMDKDVSIKHFLCSMPTPFDVSKGDEKLSGIFCEIETSGKAITIERFKVSE